VSEQEIKVDIELLKKDVVTMSALLEKFDTTIDKMQEIAINLSKMLSLQEQRLENQEKTTSEVQSILEMRRIETNGNIKDIYNRIDTVNKDLTVKIEDTEKAILAELQKLREDIQKEDRGIASRIGQIEMWKYGVVLVVIVIAWLAGQANLLENLIK
jgi:ferritin-like metal-binding protein YciE